MTQYSLVKEDALTTKEDWLRKFDEGAKETLLAFFGHNASKKWKKIESDGAINYVAAANDHSGKRYDTYNPKWCQCPAPVKDANGKYTKRCEYHITSEGKKSTAEAAAHMEIEHRDWWYETNKWFDRQPNGEMLERPPKSFEIKFPRWKEDGQKDYGSKYEKSLDDAKRTYLAKKGMVAKTVDDEHKAEIEEAVAEVRKGPGRPAKPKEF